MLLRAVCSISALLFLVACGDTGKSNDRIKTYDIDSPNAVEASADWQVRCLDSRNCPNTVGQLLMVAGGKGGVCTATLIGPNLALTNSHCFDSHPGRTPESICTGGRTVMIFATNSPSGREVVECESVVRKSELKKSEGFHSPDYMILKLKRSLTRGYETVNTSGVSDGQTLVIKKVNPTRRNLGELEVSRCEVVHGTIFMPKNKSPESAVHVTKGCQVIQGNSGSSLFDSEGKVRGVIFATLDPEEMEKADIEGIKEMASVIRRVRAGYMTNAACMRLTTERQLPYDCKPLASATDEIPMQETGGYEELKRSAIGLINDPRFRHDLVEGESIGLTAKVSLRPVCYNLSNPPSSSSNISVPVINWKVFLTLNERLQATMKLGRAQEQSCLFRIRTQQSTADIIVEPLTLDCSLALTRKTGWNETETWKPCSRMANSN
jgi:hypothetical protein